MVRSLFGNSNRKLRSTFWGSLFIPVGTNQTECCLPFSNFSVPDSGYTNSPVFLDSNRNGCGNSTVNCGKLVNRLPSCFRHPNRIFLSNGKHPRYILIRLCNPGIEAQRPAFYFFPRLYFLLALAHLPRFSHLFKNREKWFLHVLSTKIPS